MTRNLDLVGPISLRIQHMCITLQATPTRERWVLFRMFWDTFSSRTQVTSCGTEFHAVNQANSRGGKDYIATGVVKAVCARHCFVLPNAVGDLQRGERYVAPSKTHAMVLIAP